ncbi:hypothetical protein MNBD_GAMMA25-1377 [hydrothermal vent metagenome]|uniref:Uncharacterized protein n=1 Tax=hydrothermal vent metagenome TaxID=652676 RepID=A0A3B1BQ41_9ZZZZ
MPREPEKHFNDGVRFYGADDFLLAEDEEFPLPSKGIDISSP